MIGLRIPKKILIVLFVTLLFNCTQKDLTVEKMELCENFDSYGICKEPLEKDHLFTIRVDKTKKFETWYSLSNYLYFHSRQTPGFILRFNRQFTPGERDKIKKNYKAYYNFKDSKGEMEGFEIGDDWVGSFQYLGSMLKERQKEKGEDKNFPYVNNVFPADLEFKYWSDSFRGDVKLKINLVIENKE